MKFFLPIFLAGFLWAFSATAQQRADPPVPPENSKLNQLDAQGKRNGLWLSTKKPRMGEPGFREFGNYDHGIKYGIWYKVDDFGDLVAAENFRNNVLDGEVKYYEQGKLYCTGHYRGLNPLNDFDTIMVMHPVSQEEEYRVIPTEQGSLRHGTWKYYDPQNGHLIKEEEYQVDELVYKKDYEVSPVVDSLLRKKHQARMPHQTGKIYTPPPGKNISYLEE